MFHSLTQSDIPVSALSAQAIVRASGRFNRLVTASLAVEIYTLVMIFRGMICWPVFRPKRLQRCTGLEQGAIQSGAILRHKLLSCCLSFDPLKQQFVEIRGHKPISVLPEGRVIPDFVMHAKPHGPAKRQIVINAFTELPFGADIKKICSKVARMSISGGVECRPD